MQICVYEKLAVAVARCLYFLTFAYLLKLMAEFQQYKHNIKSKNKS